VRVPTPRDGAVAPACFTSISQRRLTSTEGLPLYFMQAPIPAVSFAASTQVRCVAVMPSHIFRQSFFSGSPRESGELKEAMRSTTFSQSTGAAGAGATVVDDPPVVDVAPSFLSQATAARARTNRTVNEVFFISLDTPGSQDIFLAISITIWHSEVTPCRTRRVSAMPSACNEMSLVLPTLQRRDLWAQLTRRRQHPGTTHRVKARIRYGRCKPRQHR
jgi:hypothetical protein